VRHRYGLAAHEMDEIPKQMRPNGLGRFLAKIER
jgi:hypothetical protein